MPANGRKNEYQRRVSPIVRSGGRSKEIHIIRIKQIVLPLSRQELADHFGIQKYSLLRCLNELKQEGVIRVEGRHVQILSPLLIS